MFSFVCVPLCIIACVAVCKGRSSYTRMTEVLLMCVYCVQSCGNVFFKDMCDCLSLGVSSGERQSSSACYIKIHLIYLKKRQLMTCRFELTTLYIHSNNVGISMWKLIQRFVHRPEPCGLHHRDAEPTCTAALSHQRERRAPWKNSISSH